MANRIQLRRDTADNWTRVNPVLDDGEPGLDITTNQIKYGDGNTAWRDLAYASGGGGVSFEYSTVQEGLSVGPGAGGVTSITGDHATTTGVGLTSENWAQLMWVPDTSVITVDDIDNGPAVYNWAYVGNDGFHIENKIVGTTNGWLFDVDGNLTMPLVTKLNSGGIGVTNSAEFGTEVVMGCVNVFSSEIYMGAGTAESRAIVDELGRSLIYTGVELPGFAGMVAIDPGVTSEYGIRVGANANIEIGAVVGPITTTEYVAGIGVLNDSYNINGLFANANVTVVGSGTHGWTFDAGGNLTLPVNGDILVNGGANSAIRDLLQNDVHTDADHYTLALSDRGKMIYQTGGYNVIVPAADGSTITFPVSTVITIVNSGGAGDLNIVAADGGTNTDIYGAGTDTNSYVWALPSNSIATLIKVEGSGTYSKWLLSGVGIYDNS